MDMAKHNSILQTNRNNGAKLSREEASQVVALRILLILVVDIVIGSLLDFVRADSTREYTFVFEVCPWLTWVFGVLCAAAIGYFVWSLVKKVDTRKQPMTPAMILALCLYLFAIVLLYKQLTMVMILSVMVIASVLFAVYYIYTNLLY